jgi:hypothetical protein
MMQNQTPQNLLPQLSINSVVTMGINLYRTHLKQYFQLAIIAHLWLLVPVYGYAKFCANAALISRLAFYELIHQPENIKQASSKVNRRLGEFFITGILVFILPAIQVLLVVLLFSLILSIIVTVIRLTFAIKILTSLAQPLAYFGNNLLILSVLYLYSIIFLLVYILLPLWFYSPMFLTDVSLSTENNIRLFSMLKQGWQLTKALKLRIISIIFITFSITLPITILTWLIASISLALLIIIFPQISEFFAREDSLISILFFGFFSFCNGVISMPIWQCIKSVVYYDIRCRRDGWDLNLRQHQLLEPSQE